MKAKLENRFIDDEHTKLFNGAHVIFSYFGHVQRKLENNSLLR